MMTHMRTRAIAAFNPRRDEPRLLVAAAVNLAVVSVFVFINPATRLRVRSRSGLRHLPLLARHAA
jgi:hypothetical protein